MTGALIGSIILWLIVAIIAIVVIVYLLNWLYHRSTKEVAFVRTGFGGETVVINGGALVLPIIHEVTPVNLNVVRIAVERAKEEAVITRDRMRVDIEAEFFVRVAQNRDSVAAAASTLGRRMMEPDSLADLLNGKFVGALRSVAAEMTLDEMHERRGDFVVEVASRAAEALARNGLELESVAITDLDQTDLEYFNPANRFDAEGLTELIERIESRRKLRNDIEQSSMLAIRSRNLEAEKESLKLEQESQSSRLDQERALEAMRAEQRATIQRTRVAQEAEAEKSRIESEHETRRFDIDKRRTLEEAEIKAHQEIEAARIAQERALEQARIEREKILRSEQIKQRHDIETNEISANEDIERTRIVSERQLAEARIAAEQETESREIARNREIEKARIERDKLIQAQQIAQRQAIEAAEVAAREEVERARILSERQLTEDRITSQQETEARDIARNHQVEKARIEAKEELEQAQIASDRQLRVARVEAEEQHSARLVKRNEHIEQIRIATEQALDKTRIERERLLKSQEIAQRQSIEEAEISANEEIERARIASDRGLDEARILKQQDLKKLEIQREQVLELVEIERQIAILNKKAQEAATRIETEAARAKAVEAEEAVATVREKRIAERVAEIDRLMAKKDADSALIAAEAAKVTDAVAAEAQRLRNEAENVLTVEARASLLKTKLVERLEGIVRESVRPIENIEGIKILHVDGLGGDGGGKGRSPTDEVIDSALRYRVQAPLIDEVMKEIGVEGSNVARMGDVFRAAKDAQSIAKGAAKKGGDED